MSSDEMPNVPSPRDSREAVREKAKKVHAQQSRVRAMRRTVIGVLAVAAVGGIGTAVALAVTSTISKPELSPTGMDGDGVVVSDIATSLALPVPTTDADSSDATSQETSVEGDAAGESTTTPTTESSAAVDIHIYVDYLSPGAAEFETANARQISTWIDEKVVSVTYHPIAILTASSNGTKYSLRAAAAAACVATHSPDKFYDFNHELLTSQPKIDTDGPTDEELATTAQAVGVDNPKVVRSCIEQQDYVSWAKEATSRALSGPLAGSDDVALTGAPMVIVNGEAYVGALDDPAEFAQFVLTVAADGDDTESSPAPSDTATPTDTATDAPVETPATEETPAG